MIDRHDLALVLRHIRREALHTAEQAVGRVLERHGIHRDPFGRFELLDLAIDGGQGRDRQRPGRAAEALSDAWRLEARWT